MAINVELLSLAEEALHNLRKVRTLAVQNPSGKFNENELALAEELVESMAGLCLGCFDGEDPIQLVSCSKAALEQIRSRIGDVKETSRNNLNNGDTILRAINRLELSRDPMGFLVRDSQDYNEVSRLGQDDIIISPLSTGPILVRYVQKMLELPNLVVLAAIDARDCTKVALPDRSSWPNKTKLSKVTGKFVVVDDCRGTGLQRRVLQSALNHRHSLSEKL